MGETVIIQIHTLSIATAIVVVVVVLFLMAEVILSNLYASLFCYQIKHILSS